MFYIIFLSFLIFFKQHTDDAMAHQSLLGDILLTTLICPAQEKSIISEKFHTTGLKNEIRCSDIIIDRQKEDDIIKSITPISSCKINFLKDTQSVVCSIRFDPTVVKIHAEKIENKEGGLIIIWYIYDKKIIDMLEICTKKSILQYTFNRSFSLPLLYVKT